MNDTQKAVVQAWEDGDSQTLRALRLLVQTSRMAKGDDIARGGLADLDFCPDCDSDLLNGCFDGCECLDCEANKCPDCGLPMDDHDMRQIGKGGTIGLCPGAN